MLVLLLGTGLWLSWKSRFFQLRGWRTILRRTFGSLRKSAASADLAGSAPALTQFQTFSAALAAAMGTGNIIGVAVRSVWAVPAPSFGCGSRRCWA